MKIGIEDVLLLVLTFSMRHNLSKIATVDLLKMINLIVGIHSLPETHYKFTKYCSHLVNSSKHYYCKKCSLYFGILDDIATKDDCTNCNSASKTYFLVNSMKEKLTDIIKRNFSCIQEYKNKLKEGVIDDILQANALSNLNIGKYFSLSLNTDGVALFSSNSKKSFWPVIISINDLPPYLRFQKKNLILAGLWLDSNIQIDVFLKPFMDELCFMYNSGIDFFNNNYKIICLILCADSVARCKLLNMKQFNGKYGCTYCTHPGNPVVIGGKY